MSWQNTYFKKITNPLAELMVLLNTLRVNEEKVERKLLETTYKAAYETLKTKIKICICAIALDDISNSMVFHKEDIKKMKAVKQTAIRYFQDGKEMESVFKVAFQSYNTDRILKELSIKLDEFEEKYYQDYWVSNIKDDEVYKLPYSTLIKCWMIDGEWRRPYDQTLFIDGKEVFIPKTDVEITGYPLVTDIPTPKAA